MSIRYLAVELYRALKRLEELESRLKLASEPGERADLEVRVLAARKEYERLHALLETKKRG